MPAITVNLPEKLIAQVKNLAKQKKTTQRAIFEESIEQYSKEARKAKMVKEMKEYAEYLDSDPAMRAEIQFLVNAGNKQYLEMLERVENGWY